MRDLYTQTGRTSRLMQHAPRGAFFVVPFNATVTYYINLALHLGRLDLILRGPAFLSLRGQHYRDHDPAMVVVDHFTWDAIPAADAAAAAKWWLAHTPNRSETP